MLSTLRLPPTPPLSGTEIRATVAEGATLPASCYTDRSFFELEQSSLFASSWMYVGRLEQLRKPGDFVTANVAGVPTIVVVEPSGELRAFVNVCPHRGAEISLDGCGHRKTIQCHYHGWTWGLDGNLRAAPGSKDEACFRKEDFSLTPMGVGTFGPFVFVNTDANADDFADVFGGLERKIRLRGTDLNQLKYRETRTYEIACNWKVVVENYLECYHCRVAHPGFAGLIDLNEYRTTCEGQYSYQAGPLKSNLDERTEALFGDRPDSQDGHYNFIFPSFMVNSYPGKGNASTNIIVPVTADKTIAVYDFYYDDDVSDDDAKVITDFVDEVMLEDIRICESVQRGLRSGRYYQGRVMMDKENGVNHFQRMVADIIPA